MSFELDGVIQAVLCNQDGTVDYVFDDAKLGQQPTTKVAGL